MCVGSTAVAAGSSCACACPACACPACGSFAAEIAASPAITLLWSIWNKPASSNRSTYVSPSASVMCARCSSGASVSMSIRGSSPSCSSSCACASCAAASTGTHRNATSRRSEAARPGNAARRAREIPAEADILVIGLVGTRGGRGGAARGARRRVRLETLVRDARKKRGVRVRGARRFSSVAAAWRRALRCERQPVGREP